MRQGKAQRVVDSINAPHGELCVDIFVRPDGTYGFQEYRRDVEDPSGWFALGYWKDRQFSTEGDALKGAVQVIGWLAEIRS